MSKLRMNASVSHITSALADVAEDFGVGYATQALMSNFEGLWATMIITGEFDKSDTLQEEVGAMHKRMMAISEISLDTDKTHEERVSEIVEFCHKNSPIKLGIPEEELVKQRKRNKFESVMHVKAGDLVKEHLGLDPDDSVEEQKKAIQKLKNEDDDMKMKLRDLMSDLKEAGETEIKKLGLEGDVRLRGDVDGFINGGEENPLGEIFDDPDDDGDDE